MLTFLLCSVIAAGDANYSREFSFGYLIEAFDAAQSNFAARSLDLDRERSLAIGRLNKEFKQSNRRRAIAMELRNLRRSQLGLDELFEAYQESDSRVRAFNGEDLKKIDAVYDDGTDLRKFRQVLTIYLLSVGSVESILRLHNVNMNASQYQTLIEKRIDLRRNENAYTKYLYESSLRSVGDMLTKEELADATGDPYPHTFPGENRSIGNPIDAFYQEAGLKLLLDPKVQVELEMSIDQVKQLTASRGVLESRFGGSAANRIAFGGGNPNEIKDRLADLQRQLDREIRRQLKTTQAKRLEQLLFQFHVRRVDHAWALKVIGKDAKVHSPLETNQVRDEAVYTQAAIELRQNMGMLIDVVGHDKAMMMCGGILVLPHRTSDANDKKDEAIRRKVERKFLSTFDHRPRNPRREGRNAN